MQKLSKIFCVQLLALEGGILNTCLFVILVTFFSFDYNICNAQKTGKSTQVAQILGDGKYQYYNIDGLEILVGQSNSPIVGVSIGFVGGVQMIAKGDDGLEALLMQCLLKCGTTKYSANDFFALAQTHGIELSAYTNIDHSIIKMRCLNKHFSLAWDLLSETIIHNTFETQAYLDIRDEWASHIQNSSQNYFGSLEKKSQASFFKNHVYSKNNDATFERLITLTPDSLQNIYQKLLVKNRIKITITGNVNPDSVLKKITDSFKTLPIGISYKRIPEHQATYKIAQINEMSTNGGFIFGYFAPIWAIDDKVPAIKIVTRALSDRLAQELNFKRQVTNDIAAIWAPLRLSFGEVAFSSNRPVPAIKSLVGVLQSIKKFGFLPDELAQAKQKLLNEYFLSFDNQQEFSNMLCIGLINGSYKQMINFPKLVAALPNETLNRIANRYFSQIQWHYFGNKKDISSDLFLKGK